MNKKSNPLGLRLSDIHPFSVYVDNKTNFFNVIALMEDVDAHFTNSEWIDLVFNIPPDNTRLYSVIYYENKIVKTRIGIKYTIDNNSYLDIFGHYTSFPNEIIMFDSFADLYLRPPAKDAGNLLRVNNSLLLPFGQ